MRVPQKLLQQALVAAGAALVLTAMPSAVAAADPVTLVLEAPKDITLGEPVTVTAVLRDATGAPIRGATVVLWTPMTFLSVASAVELGRAATDARGVAAFRYAARRDGEVVLTASFAGDSRYAAAQATAAATAQGSAQLYTQTAGVRVPGISVWLLAGVMLGVWSVYFTVMVLLALIARAGGKAPYQASQGVGGRHG